MHNIDPKNAMVKKRQIIRAIRPTKRTKINKEKLQLVGGRDKHKLQKNKRFTQITQKTSEHHGTTPSPLKNVERIIKLLIDEQLKHHLIVELVLKR